MNIIEYMREESIKSLFLMKSFKKSFPTWKKYMDDRLGANPDYLKLLNLGDSLSQIFRLTGGKDRTQGDVSAGGYAWEGLVCWYLNLCLVGSRTVVIKHSKKIIPSPIADAISVNYGSFTSNTESDLIAITFPQDTDFLQDISNFKESEKFNYMKTIDLLCQNNFSKLRICIIQCKTNWKDNAQIPMLWEIVYSSEGFKNKNISVGKNGVSMRDFEKFCYAFVTVPTGEKSEAYTPGCLPVKRVYNLSGGNYWGLPSYSGVAHSIKEIFNQNFTDGWVYGTQKKDVESMLKNKKHLSYFNLSL